MEGMLHSPTPNVSDEFETMVSIFLEIARGETAATAIHFLQATSWNFEEALELYLSGGGSRPVHLTQEPNSLINFEQEATRRPGVWDSELGAAASKAETSQQDNLASLYRPPFHLMFNGSFDKAKSAASMDDKWLLVNIQSTKEFSSYMLNRDTWANDAVSQIISTNFIFWQAKMSALITDWIQFLLCLLLIPSLAKMRSWGGMVQPESLLEGLLRFLDAGPMDHHNTLSHKCPRGSSSPSKTKDSDASEEEDEEFQRALAASFESVKESSEMAEGANKDANVAGNLQETALIKFEKLMI